MGSTAVRSRAFGVASFHERCGDGAGVDVDASVGGGLVFLTPQRSPAVEKADTRRERQRGDDSNVDPRDASASVAGAMAGVAYFERDFDFDNHAREVEATWDPAVGGGPAPSPSVAALDGAATAGRVGTNRRGPETGDEDGATPTTSEAQARAWDDFHGTHDSGVFFKERRYLLAEFPALLEVGCVLEVGCGSGSSALPVIAANPSATVLACDWSANAVRCAERAVASRAPDDADRFEAFVCDPSTSARGALAGEVHRRLERRGGVHRGGVDAALLVFVLSAVPPGTTTATFLRRCVEAVRPGGLVCFRDYGAYDLPMLRFPPSRRLADRQYARMDGTLARFFTVDEVRTMFREAGLVEEGAESDGEATPVRYCCVHNENKRKGILMKRVFVHGAWRKPA